MLIENGHKVILNIFSPEILFKQKVNNPYLTTPGKNKLTYSHGHGRRKGGFIPPGL